MTTVSAIAIGEELLDGRLSDANACWLGGICAEHGATLADVRIVGDDIDAITAALNQASQHADVVVTSGGLGPTADDITRNAAANWAGVDLEFDRDVLERLEQRFAQLGYPFTPNNRRQCIFPAGAEILATDVGTAAAFSVRQNDCQVFFLPGVPDEFHWFIATYVVDHLHPADGRVASGLAESRANLVLFGLGESQLETKLDGIEALADRLGGRVSYRPSYPVNQIHLKAPDASGVDTMRDFVLDRVGQWLVADGDETFIERVGRHLVDADSTVTCAESCTAGRLAAKLTEISGASTWFERGFVTYANAAKVDMLGVDSAVLDAHGAVSAQTVCQMACGARRLAGADFGLATSGVAGPTGGSPQKPVGTVHLALAGPDGVWHRRASFAARGRRRVLTISVHTALAMLLWHLENHLDDHHLDGPFDTRQVWAAGGVAVD